MGVASKVIHVILRLAQLFFSVIVLGLLANFVRLLNQAGAHKDGRIIYALVVACISMLFSIVFIAPFMYAFLAFPFDIVLFIMWLIAFCLLASVSSHSVITVVDLVREPSHADLSTSERVDAAQRGSETTGAITGEDGGGGRVLRHLLLPGAENGKLSLPSPSWP